MKMSYLASSSTSTIYIQASRFFNIVFFASLILTTNSALFRDSRRAYEFDLDPESELTEADRIVGGRLAGEFDFEPHGERGDMQEGESLFDIGPSENREQQNIDERIFDHGFELDPFKNQERETIDAGRSNRGYNIELTSEGGGEPDQSERRYDRGYDFFELPYERRGESTRDENRYDRGYDFDLPFERRGQSNEQETHSDGGHEQENPNEEEPQQESETESQPEAEKLSRLFQKVSSPYIGITSAGMSWTASTVDECAGLCLSLSQSPMVMMMMQARSRAPPCTSFYFEPHSGMCVGGTLARLANDIEYRVNKDIGAYIYLKDDFNYKYDSDVNVISYCDEGEAFYLAVVDDDFTCVYVSMAKLLTYDEAVEECHNYDAQLLAVTSAWQVQDFAQLIQQEDRLGAGVDFWTRSTSAPNNGNMKISNLILNAYNIKTSSKNEFFLPGRDQSMTVNRNNMDRLYKLRRNSISRSGRRRRNRRWNRDNILSPRNRKRSCSFFSPAWSSLDIAECNERKGVVCQKRHP